MDTSGLAPYLPKGGDPASFFMDRAKVAVSDGRDFGAHHHVRINFGEYGSGWWRMGRPLDSLLLLLWILWPVNCPFLALTPTQHTASPGCPRARLEEGLQKMEAAYKAAVAAGKRQ